MKPSQPSNAPRAPGSPRVLGTALTLAVGALLSFPAPVSASAAHLAPGGDAVTVYAGRMSDEAAWQDILLGPGNVGFTDTFLAVGAWSRTFAHSRTGQWQWEIEGQVARYFGDQQHWELNAPVVARWIGAPWQHRVATSVAFALGVSYATELPPVEVALEGTSERFLAYWFMELTAGPPTSDWAVSLRLHHRSVAFGLFGTDGGMNALAVGVRRAF